MYTIGASLSEPYINELHGSGSHNRYTNVCMYVCHIYVKLT